MKEFLKSISYVTITTVSLILLIFGTSFFGLKHFEFFAPKYENARREAFLNNRSFQEGKMQELIKYKLEYETAKTDSDKQAIKSAINLSMTQIDRSKLPYELQTFLSNLNSGAY